MSSEIIIVEPRTVPELTDGVKFLLPELHTLGPTRYRIPTEVGIWTHPNQRKIGEEKGYVIYKALRAANMLPYCQSLQDGLAIQSKGPSCIFGKFFHDGYAFPMWQSVAQRPDGLYVPVFYKDGDEIPIEWVWLKEAFSLFKPTLIFKEQLR